MYKLIWAKKTEKDGTYINSAGLSDKVDEISETVERDPFEPSQHFERLKYNLKGTCSRKISKQQRFLYKVLPNTENLIDKDGKPYDGIVLVLSIWKHYGDK